MRRAPDRFPICITTLTATRCNTNCSAPQQQTCLLGGDGRASHQIGGPRCLSGVPTVGGLEPPTSSLSVLTRVLADGSGLHSPGCRRGPRRVGVWWRCCHGCCQGAVFLTWRLLRPRSQDLPLWPGSLRAAAPSPS